MLLDHYGRLNVTECEQKCVIYLMLFLPDTLIGFVCERGRERDRPIHGLPGIFSKINV